MIFKKLDYFEFSKISLNRDWKKKITNFFFVNYYTIQTNWKLMQKICWYKIKLAKIFQYRTSNDS